MRAKLTMIATMIALGAAVIGLGASLASAIDDLGPAATFCAETGCETVKASWWAAPLGIPMSVIGVLYFGVMVALTFVDKPVLRLVLALAGGAWAVFLIVLQAAVLDAWCKLCLVADPAGIVLAIAVAAGGSTLPRDKRIGLIVPAVGAVVAVLALWTRPPKLPPPPADTPAFVLKEQTKEAVTIVELVDFECPFCREMQKRLDIALTKTKVPVKLVRKMVPLPMHKGAVPAAIAWAAAEAQGKGEDMARELFAAEPEQLTPYNVERIAEKLGCDLPRYRQDIPAAVERVKADLVDAKAAGVTGLPTFFIGTARHMGAELQVDDLIAEIDRFDPR